MKKYSNLRSNYIKKLIKGLSWKRHEYIDDLIQLYNFSKPPVGWVANMGFAMLWGKYQNEYLELLKENSVERHERELQRIKQQEEELNKFKEKLRKEQEESKRDWLNVGGKVWKFVYTRFYQTIFSICSMLNTFARKHRLSWYTGFKVFLKELESWNQAKKTILVGLEFDIL